MLFFHKIKRAAGFFPDFTDYGISQADIRNLLRYLLITE